jgi:hypothetical protein
MAAFKRSEPNFKRKVANRKQRKSFLIVCEGKSTEPIYFESFRLSSVKVKGTGYNTFSLVKKAIELKKHHSAVDEVWCVFDKDDYSKKAVIRAFNMADKENIRIAFSNESFELWYLLHIQYIDCQIGRSEYIKRLDAYLKPLGIQYSKSLNIAESIRDKQLDAIKNAERLINTYSNNIDKTQKAFNKRYPFDTINSGPFTSVHDLVQELIDATPR